MVLKVFWYIKYYNINIYILSRGAEWFFGTTKTDPDVDRNHKVSRTTFQLDISKEKCLLDYEGDEFCLFQSFMSTFVRLKLCGCFNFPQFSSSGYRLIDAMLFWELKIA